MMSDSELLARFAHTHSEEAFEELVRRHIQLVYSAALRQVGGDAGFAQDVTQTVFGDLARKAAALAARPAVSGWLYTSARFAAAKVVRTEQRRRAREQEFMREPSDTASETDWEKLHPVLDEVMHELKQADRDAILLRYFENWPFAEIGAQCGINENTARMRVERALEKLRSLLAKRGVSTTAALASVISAHAVQIAPASLAATITTASVACVGTGTITLWTLMNLTKLKFALSALAVLGASTALIIEHQAREKLTTENESLTQQILQLKTDPQSRLNGADQGALLSTLPNDQMSELLRLRGQVGMLRQQTNDFALLQQENRKLLSQLATQSDPINLLPATDQFTLRKTHILDAVGSLMMAVKEFATNHNGQYPGSLDQLMSLGSFKATNFAGGLALDDFEMMPDGSVDYQGKKLILRNRVPLARPEGDSVWVYGGFDGNVIQTTMMSTDARKPQGYRFRQ